MPWAGRSARSERVGLTLVAVDFENEIKQLRATMASVRDVTDLDRLQEQITELETEASSPNLWDDVDHAQKVTSSLSRATPSPLR